MNYPGYTLVRREDCPEQHGVLTVLNHDVSGATVLLVENEDTNKAFGIGFGTFPSDDTGVFHILEHSVLAGSEKYPVTSPFLQLLKSSMASFLNAMTFPDKTVYPFATPNETDFRNLMDVYLNAVFCPLAMVDKAVFEQEGWHRDADGTVSGVVYNEMQGALASPDAQLQNALERAMFPDTAYGFVSGGDPASIPALTYEKYQRVYRRHYSADNCCITLYGKMDMAEKLAFLDEHYLSRMPKGPSRPRLTVQDQQNGVRVHIPYYTENPEPDQVQCALAWYTGAFADRERQLGVEILLDALLGTNNSPLKAALLAEKLGADDGCRHIDTAGLGKPGVASYGSHLVSEYHLIEQHSHQDHGDQGDHKTCLDPELAKDLGKLGVVRDGQGAQGTDGGISHGIHHDIDGKEHEDTV